MRKEAIEDARHVAQHLPRWPIWAPLPAVVPVLHPSRKGPNSKGQLKFQLTVHATHYKGGIRPQILVGIRPQKDFNQSLCLLPSLLLSPTSSSDASPKTRLDAFWT